MVEFSRYVELAYEVAKRQSWYDREMRGEGSQRAHQRFMSELATAYRENGHADASVSAARSFLQQNVGPP